MATKKQISVFNNFEFVLSSLPIILHALRTRHVRLPRSKFGPQFEGSKLGLPQNYTKFINRAYNNFFSAHSRFDSEVVYYNDEEEKSKTGTLAGFMVKYKSVPIESASTLFKGTDDFYRGIKNLEKAVDILISSDKTVSGRLAAIEHLSRVFTRIVFWDGFLGESNSRIKNAEFYSVRNALKFNRFKDGPFTPTESEFNLFFGSLEKKLKNKEDSSEKSTEQELVLLTQSIKLAESLTKLVVAEQSRDAVLDACAKLIGNLQLLKAVKES